MNSFKTFVFLAVSALCGTLVSTQIIVFQPNNYNISVPESTQVLTQILNNIMVVDTQNINGGLLNVTCMDLTSMALDYYGSPVQSPCSSFSMQSTQQSNVGWNGFMSLFAPLNYNQAVFYNLSILATDGVRSSTQFVTVYVIDDITKMPIFTNTQLNFTVNPTTVISQTLFTYTAKDGDVSKSRPIQYSLTTNPNNLFALNPVTGVLTNAAPLTFTDTTWQSGFVTINVKAAVWLNSTTLDSASTTTIQSVITMSDTSTTPPVFAVTSYSGSIASHSANGSVVTETSTGASMVIVVTIKNHNVMNSLMTLTVGDTSNTFGITPTSAQGVISASIIVIDSNILNYNAGPQYQSYQFNVTAVNPQGLTASAIIYISVLATNDFWPVFNPAVYYPSVSETAVGGTYVTQVNATCANLGAAYGTASIWYTFQTATSLFRCGRLTGQITVAPCLTPGTAPCISYSSQRSYNLSVLAINNYGEGKSATATVIINIINQNIQAPIFSQLQYIGSITEYNTTLDPPGISVTATDDYINNITYSIIQGNVNNLWTIMGPNNTIVATRSVSTGDAPNCQGYFLLTIQAKNNFTSTATARISITPVDKYSPIFDTLVYTAAITSNTPPGTPVTYVHATDANSACTGNGIVKYSILTGGLGNFIVDPNNGSVTVNQGATLTTQPTYNMTIQAQDQGSGGLKALAMLYVTVTINIIGPNFVSPFIRLSTLQTATLGTQIGSVTAVDNSVGAQLMYSFVNQTQSGLAPNNLPVTLNSTQQNMFSINATTGAVYVNGPLNPQTVAIWKCVVQAIDQNNATLAATTTLIISIYSVNMVAPQFALPWTASSPYENLTLVQLNGGTTGLAIALLQAVSPNNSLVISYTLANNYNGDFGINSNTGQVSLLPNTTLSYDTNNNVMFVVLASDNGQPPLTSTLTMFVTLENVNAYLPIFSQAAYNATIYSNSPGGTPVITVNATIDPRVTGTLTYSVLGDSRFVINSTTGLITVAYNALPFDTSVQKSILLSVACLDTAPDPTKSRFSNVDVTVYLINPNSSPVFGSNIYAPAPFAAEIPIGSTMVQTTTTDPNNGQTGPIEYRIIAGDPNGYFQINPTTGAISTLQSMIQHAGSYNLTVLAYYQNQPSLNSTVQVLITIRPSVHNPPVWYTPASNAQIYFNEGQAVGTKVTQCYANESSNGISSNVTYWQLYIGGLVSLTPTFNLDSNTGLLTAAVNFTYELYSTPISVTLVAMDSTQASANQYIQVIIQEVNVVNPTFNATSNNCCAAAYFMTVDKSAPISSVIGTVKATLPNLLRSITYTMLPDVNDYSQYFSVIPSTGQIIIQGNLAQLVASPVPYRLRIEAFHNTLLPLPPLAQGCTCNNASYVFVYITVTDVLQAVPQFLQQIYNVCIADNTPIGQPVFQCNNTDYNPLRPVDYLAASLINNNDTGATTISNLPYPNIQNLCSNPTGYASQYPSSKGIAMPPCNGTVVTASSMMYYEQSYFQLKVNASFSDRRAHNDITSFSIKFWVVPRSSEMLVTINSPPAAVMANLSFYTTAIGSQIIDNGVPCGVTCVDSVRYHVSPEGAVNTQQTDILLWLVDGCANQIISPLIYDMQFGMAARKASGIIGITNAYATWAGFSYIPVAAAIGIIIGLLVLALILFICCCCCWSWLFKRRVTKSEPLIHYVAPAPVNPIWQKMFEDQLMSHDLTDGEPMNGGTIAIRGAYNDAFDENDGDVFDHNRGRQSQTQNLSQTTTTTTTGHPPPGLVHIEASLSDPPYENSTSAANAGGHAGAHPLNLEQVHHVTGSAPAAGDGGSQVGGVYTSFTASGAGDYPDDRATARSYSVAASVDDRPGSSKPRHQSSYDAPVVELNDTRSPADKHAKIGATLYQPFGISGEAYPQSVISGRDSYMDGDYRMGGAGASGGSMRGYEDGTRSALPLQNEIVFDELRPDNMYENNGRYEDGYQDGDGGMYQGEIHLGTMSQSLHSPGSDNAQETRFL